MVIQLQAPVLEQAAALPSSEREQKAREDPRLRSALGVLAALDRWRATDARCPQPDQLRKVSVWQEEGGGQVVEVTFEPYL
jgi:hypothetical protein